VLIIKRNSIFLFDKDLGRVYRGLLANFWVLLVLGNLLDFRGRCAIDGDSDTIS